MARIRQIKPEFFIDDELAQCSRDARLLFIGLWVIADREGRLENRPGKIKAQVFPYDADMTAQKIGALLQQLAGKSFIIAYTAGERKLIQIRSFVRHQHCHVKEAASTLPPCPDQLASNALRELDLAESTGKAPDKNGTSTVLAPDLHRSSTPTSTSTLGNGEMDNGVLSMDLCSERSQSDRSERDPPAAWITIPLVDGQEHPIRQSEVDEYRQLYPAVDVEQELRNYRGWALANPRKRKTRAGIMKSVNSWLAKVQDRGGRPAGGRTGARPVADDGQVDRVLALMERGKNGG